MLNDVPQRHGSILEVYRPWCAAESTRVKKIVILIFAMHSVGWNLSEACTFRLQNKAFFQECVSYPLTVTCYSIYLKAAALWCIVEDAQHFVTCSNWLILILTKCFSL